MASFAAFVEQLLKHGTVVLRARPQVEASDRRETERLLADAFADYRLEIAGPPISFNASTALDAAERLWWALWFLLQRGDAAEETDKRLTLPPPPLSAAQHLSADLVVRFVPQAHRRAKRADAADVLTKRLESVQKAYPS